MSQLFDFFSKLFDTSDWSPRWQWGTWSSFHGWFYIISDLCIWAAYYAILFLIIRMISKKQKKQFSKIYWLFATFILACGSTYLLDAITFWYPIYRLNALARCITATVCWVTVVHIFKLLPAVITLKSEDELVAEIEYRKKLEQELIDNNVRLNEAEKIAKLGHWKWIAANNLIKASPNFFKIYEVPFQEIGVKGEMNKYIHADDREFVKSKVALVLQIKEYGQFYFRINTPNGKEKTLLAKGIVQLNDKNEIAFILGTIQDVTEQKAIENELLQKTLALESMNANLQKFASVASHDLQEPLRKITSFLTLLQKHYAANLDQKGQGFIAKTVHATTRMQQLIQSILEFSKLPTQELSFTQVNLTNVLNMVLNHLEIAITEKQAIVTVDKLPAIVANHSQMQQLFKNIISNSIKFTKSDQQPIITITNEIIKKAAFSQEDFSAENRQGAFTQSFCQITITDNGIGFDESYSEQIFLPFQRLNSKTEFEGTGIGLAICKKIVENHNGSIIVKSKVNEGSTFIIQLPVHQQ